MQNMKIKQISFLLFFLLFCQLNGFAQCINGKINLGTGFSAVLIPHKIATLMRGKSYPKGALVPLEDLRYVQVKHIGFDGKTHRGELVVHKSVSCEVVEIFKELYKEQYPIEKMRLVDYYDANDQKSMADNNSSSFCWRMITSGGLLSYHALGLAIDINPLQNPYVRGSVIEPIEGKEFINREQNVQGMIFENDAAVRAFKKRGWKWGGNWKKTKGYYDLQHFEKPSSLRDEYMQEMKKQSANP